MGMRRALRVTKLRKIVKRTPGGGYTVHIRKPKPDYAHCPVCGKKIVRARLRPIEVKKLPKVQRRPERPYPELCPNCARERIKEMTRMVISI